MRQHDKDTVQTHDALQAAFDAAAPNLDMPLGDGMPMPNRSVGAFVLTLQAKPIVGLRSPEQAFAVDHECFSADAETKAVIDLVQRWEQPGPKDILETWETCATQPAMGVSTQWVAPIDVQEIRRALESEDFAKQQKKFPFFEPRRIRILDPKVSFLSADLAVVTYVFEEDYQHGETFVSNSFLVATKRESWKVAVFTKRRWYDDHRPKSTRS